MNANIENFIQAAAEKGGYYALDVTYKREGGRFVLRVTLDKEGGVTMDECARLSSELSELLDKENIISDEDTLEVCSPGLDRKLKTDKDFVWAVGKKVKVSTYTPLDGKRAFSGTLLGLGDGTVVVQEEDASIEIPRDKIANAKLNEV